MTVVVSSAKAGERQVVAALMQDYLAEFATFDYVEQDADGRYVYPYLPHYWEDPHRYPFLLRVDDEIAGFALTRLEADPANGRMVMDMAEFYVVPAYRRRGVGDAAARRLWDLFPGNWSVRVLASNKGAYPFWKQAISSYTDNQFREESPQRPVGGIYTFTFATGTDVDIPDDLEPDFLDY
ncbi:MAG: GNAT family N-acetyltransferase [Pseudomonadales bacterium]|nr:GNAT family N-acetyltransferase [Pseudomonadales bacterium]